MSCLFLYTPIFMQTSRRTTHILYTFMYAGVQASISEIESR